jgi:hypothetical protein
MNTPDPTSTPSEGTRQAECPYVTGSVTRYCTLTPFTLTDLERTAIAAAADDYRYPPDPGGRAQHIERTLRGLLERTSPASTPQVTADKEAPAACKT